MEGSNILREHEAELQELLSSLPACRRCRANKRRCDTELPSCRNCSKAGADCVFFDHVLREDLPRSYIASLVDALGQSTSPVHWQPRNNEDTVQESDASAQSLVQNPLEPPAPSRLSPRYIGRLSCLSKSLRIRGEESVPHPIPRSQPFPLSDLEADLIVTPQMHQFLVEIYLKELHPLYPFLDISYHFLSPWEVPSQTLTHTETFIVQMVYSIACFCVPAVASRLSNLSDACYSRATKFIEAATANLTVTTLQAITLLALRGLFDPQKVNFGQLIAFATRLAIDIGGQDISSSEGGMRDIQTSIYCLENQYATVLDRPSFLPQLTRPIDLNLEQPSELLCSLYRIQSKYRAGDTNEAKNLFNTLDMPSLERRAQGGDLISPNILSTALETQMLLDPTPRTAARLLRSYTHSRSIHTFLTPQWTYQAALVQLEQEQDISVIEAYGACMVILDRAALRWPGVTALSDSLRLHIRAKLSSKEQQTI